MTYISQESSAEGGRPVEGFSFAIGPDTFLYTSAEDIISIGPDTWTPIPISRGEILVGQDERNTPLGIEIPASDPLAQRFIDVVPGVRTTLTIKRFHRDDPDAEVRTIYVGFVVGATFTQDLDVASLTAKTPEAAFKNLMPRRSFGGRCGHVLGDGLCKVNLATPSFSFSGVVSDITGNTLTIEGLGAFGDGFFDAGQVNYLGIERRAVYGQTGDVVSLQLPFSNDVLGKTVEVITGCDHLIDGDCNLKFGNVIEFGGFAHTPTKNPFRTDIV